MGGTLDVSVGRDCYVRMNESFPVHALHNKQVALALDYK
jgi:hypothetical protein